METNMMAVVVLLASLIYISMQMEINYGKEKHTLQMPCNDTTLKDMTHMLFYCDDREEYCLVQTRRFSPICDSLIDCLETARDEMNCTEDQFKENCKSQFYEKPKWMRYFTCDNKMCINANDVNDTIMDCTDGSDEW